VLLLSEKKKKSGRGERGEKTPLRLNEQVNLAVGGTGGVAPSLGTSLTNNRWKKKGLGGEERETKRLLSSKNGGKKNKVRARSI